MADGEAQAEAEAVFTVEGERVFASERAMGPWDPTTQHGGAPAALLAWAAERVPATVPMQVARMAVDLMRPAPLGELRLATQIVRQGRQIQLIEASLFAGEKEVTRAHVLRIRAERVAVSPLEDEPDVPHPDECPPIPVFQNSGFGKNMQVRQARGSARRGPAAAWFRMINPVVAGAPISGVMRAMAASDFGNGVSMTLDMNRHSFINADVTVQIMREPVGEWILIDAVTYRGDAGRGLTESRLADSRGYFGRAAQSLVIAKRGG